MIKNSMNWSLSELHVKQSLYLFIFLLRFVKQHRQNNILKYHLSSEKYSKRCYAKCSLCNCLVKLLIQTKPSVQEIGSTVKTA